jgi:hypothetical protein
MKKQLLNLCFVAVALGLFVTKAHSQLVLPLQTLDVEFAAGAMTMDADAAEATYSDEQATTIFNPTGYDGSDADFKAVIKLTWDMTYLYIWAQMNDDIEEDFTWTYSSSWMFDNCEVFLQLDTATVPTAYNSRTVQLRVCRGLDSVETAGRAARTDYIYSMDSQSDKWITETAIPWTSVMEAGEGPELIGDYINVQIGFDFSGADSDDTDADLTVGNRDCQSAWDSDLPDDAADRSEDNAWNNTSVFGRITLLPVGIETPTLSTIDLYPNPTTGILHLDVNGQVDIYNVAGTLVKSVEAVNNTINTADLSEGIYFIRTATGMAKFIRK